MEHALFTLVKDVATKEDCLEITVGKLSTVCPLHHIIRDSFIVVTSTNAAPTLIHTCIKIKYSAIFKLIKRLALG